MKYLFYLGHPAHFHYIKHALKKLESHGHQVKIVCKKKDILESLLDNSHVSYINIQPWNRKPGKKWVALSLLRRDLLLYGIVRKWRPDLMLGTSAEITHIGRLCRIPSIVINEDDAEVIPGFAHLAYPFATYILAPDCCSVGKWKKKKLSYNSYHELAYLHPNYFQPNRAVKQKLGDQNGAFFVLRFSKLDAYHDSGKKGINDEVAQRLIDLLEPHGRIYISSERTLPESLRTYALPIPPSQIHDALYYASMYIGDSQTMTAEAALLGTPAIRFNGFIGTLGYLNELEERYHLTTGISATEPERLFETIEKWLAIKHLKKIWRARARKCIAEKMDFTELLVELCYTFPNQLPEKLATSCVASPATVTVQLRAYPSLLN